MKHSKKIRSAAGFLAVAWAVVALVACGSGAASYAPAETTTAEAPASDYYDGGELSGHYSGAVAYSAADDTAAEVDYDDGDDEYEAAEEAGGNGAGSPAEATADQDRKIIMNAWVTLESLEYDEATAAIERLVNEHGAYFSSSSVYNSTVGSRNADYTVRVPAANYRALITALESAGNMVSRSESSEDITTQYIDIEARLTSLRAQEERLMELMAEAGDLESLILVQQQLSDTQYEIEYYEGIKRSYDRQVSYSTIQIYLHEVVEYTEPEPEGYISQLGYAFTSGWRNALGVVQSIGLAIVGGLPLLLLLSAAIVLLVVLLKRSRKGSAAKLEEMRSLRDKSWDALVKPQPTPAQPADADGQAGPASGPDAGTNDDKAKE